MGFGAGMWVNCWNECINISTEAEEIGRLFKLKNFTYAN
jgi:hypothetical protein